MGFSPLANMSRRIAPGRRQSPRNSKITGFTIHHNAGINSYGMATNPDYQVSANYWITNEGVIIPNVDENMRAWTTGAKGYPAGAASDHRNITVEVSNSGTGGKWPISAAARAALVALIADVFSRHKLGAVKRGKNSGVAVHQDFVPTVCPGPTVMDGLSSIIADAEKARSGGSSGGSGGNSGNSGSGLPARGVAMLKGARIGDHLSIRNWWTYSNAALTRKVATVTGTFKIIGISYKDRGGVEPSIRVQDAAGAKRWVHYSAVDGRSSKKLTRFSTSSSSGTSKPKPARKTDEQLAAEVWQGLHGDGEARKKSLGSRYTAVQRLVDRGVGRGGSSARKSNAQIAREIVYGVNGRNPWGNDPERSRKLRAAGYDPAAVQREVNKLI